MDNILINLDDGLRLGGYELPNIGEQTDIISQSDTLVGPPGPPGPRGPAGSDGQAATITVGTTTTGSAGTNAQVQNSGTSSAAVLDFTIPRGATGADGQAATITVGSTTTGAPGSNASVVNSGDEQDAVLDFTIPTGNDGAAATVAVGSVTSVDYEYPATVTNSGTTSAAVLDFEIPRGVPGETGPAGQDGSDGQAATITVGSTTTGSAGTNASVTNSGTSSAAVLNFIIPRGETGATGPQGPAGPTSIASLYVSAAALSADLTLTNGNTTTIQTITLTSGTWRLCWGYRVAAIMSGTKFFYTGISSGSTIYQTALNMTADNDYASARVMVNQSYEITTSTSMTINTYVNLPAGTITSNGSITAQTAYFYALKVN